MNCTGACAVYFISVIISVMLLARIFGGLQWTCPHCRNIQKTRLTPVNWWKIRCKYKHCQHRYAFGIVLCEMKEGFKVPPSDTIMVVEGVWRTGSPINKMICASCTQVIVE